MDSLTEMVLLDQHKDEYGVSVTDEDEAAIKEAAQKFMDDNDADMLAAAEIGIGFGGVRSIAPSLLRCATHATYSEEKLCQFLRQLL